MRAKRRASVLRNVISPQCDLPARRCGPGRPRQRRPLKRSRRRPRRRLGNIGDATLEPGQVRVGGWHRSAVLDAIESAVLVVGVAMETYDQPAAGPVEERLVVVPTKPAVLACVEVCPRSFEGDGLEIAGVEGPSDTDLIVWAGGSFTDFRCRARWVTHPKVGNARPCFRLIGWTAPG